jgi:Uma2 family endonuclease
VLGAIWEATDIMTRMTPPLAGEIRLATEHLPDGAKLVVPDVTWEDYEELLQELAERPHLRVSFDSGRLEIVSPSSKHERYGEFINDLVRAYADACDSELDKLGHTTWKRKALSKGAEADGCYYIRNFERIRSKETIDLESDPPPDIVLEIEVTTDSKKKLSIYAALRVPEVWIYDGKEARFFALENDQYVPIQESQFLPRLTGAMIAEAVEASKTQGQKTALAAFRARIQGMI